MIQTQISLTVSRMRTSDEMFTLSDIIIPTSRNTQTGKDILGGNFMLGGKTGKVEEIFAQLFKKFWNSLC